METKLKLYLFEIVNAANNARIQEFVKAPSKIWKIDFAYKDAEGNAHEDKLYWITAPTIYAALKRGSDLLKKAAETFGWTEWVIWDVGIGDCKTEDIF